MASSALQAYSPNSLTSEDSKASNFAPATTLHQRQIGFQSLVDVIDTTTMGQFFFQITGAFAELERHLIRERTLAGLASARRRGRKGGRRKAIDAKTFEMALQL